MSATSLPLRLLRRGKVRDVYEVDQNRILLVATDRISAFDVVMHEPVPHKGVVLTQLTAWWLERLQNRVRHHLLSADSEEIIALVPVLEPHAALLRGRTMLCIRTTVFPVECVIRGYLSGSAWKEYRERGTLAGESLPKGLTESQRLATPLFSPATKAEQGHDENITVERMAEIVGRGVAGELERLTQTVYELGSEIAASRGIIIADTKLEFGCCGAAPPPDRNPPELSRRSPQGKPATDESFDSAGVILVDEVLTPDSSRFWPEDGYAPGKAQPSFDKQPLRDYLDGERKAGRWNGDYPPPSLPPEVVAATSERYLDIYRRLTLTSLPMERLS